MFSFTLVIQENVNKHQTISNNFINLICQLKNKEPFLVLILEKRT